MTLRNRTLLRLLPPWLMRPGGAPFQASEWNPDRLIAVVDALNVNLQRLLLDESNPGAQPDVIGNRDLGAGVVDLRQLQTEVARLADLLARGRSRDQTCALMVKIASLRGSLQDHARNPVLSPVAERIASEAAALRDELQRYDE